MAGLMRWPMARSPALSDRADGGRPDPPDRAPHVRSSNRLSLSSRLRRRGITAVPHAEKPEVFLIPAARVPELAGERWTPIDERQGLLEDFGNDWPALVEAARKFETAT